MADNDGINEEGLERLREALKIEKERSQLEEERLKWTKSRTDKLKEQRDLQGEILSKIKNSTESLMSADKIDDEAIDKLNSQIEGLGAVNAALKEQILQKQKILATQLKSLNTDEERRKYISDNIGKFKEINELTKEAIDQNKQLKKVSKDVSDAVGGIATKLGIAAEVSNTKLGKGIELAKGMFQDFGAAGNPFEALGASIADMVNPLNLIGSIFDKMIDNALALDKTSVAFQRATGFAGDFRTQINDVYSATMRSGVSMEEAGQNMQALAENFSAFDPNAKSVNAEMTKTISLLTKVGVSASESAKMMDIFNKNLGMSKKASADLTRELSRAGTSIGISSKKMASDFASNFSQIASFGNEAIDMFKDMATQSKLTGVAMGELVAIGAKFDTFQSAAEISGRLNSVLGTQFSALDMVNMNYAERIEALRAEISTVAGGFDEMDRYTQMSIAQISFGGDVAKAQRILNMSREEYIKQERKMAASAETQKQLAEITESMVPIFEKLELAFTQFAANEMVVDLLNLMSFAVEKVTWVMNTMHDGLGALGTALFFVSGLVVSIGAAFGMYALSAFSTAAANKAVGATGPAAAGGLKAVSAGLTSLTAGAGGAGVLLMTAAAVALMASSTALLVASMVMLVALMIDNISVMPDLVLGLHAISGAIFSIGSAAIATAIGVGLMAMAIAGVSVLGLAGGGVGNLEKYAAAYERIGEGVKAFSEGITSITAATAKVGSGFLAASVEGGKTSVVMSGDAGTLTNITSDKLTVDVKIPEINVPQPIVNVYINGQQFDPENVFMESIVGAGG